MGRWTITNATASVQNGLKLHMQPSIAMRPPVKMSTQKCVVRDEAKLEINYTLSIPFFLSRAYAYKLCF